MSLKVRIYLDKKLNLDLDLILEKEDAHYLKNVMRLREGDNVFLFNSKDGEFKGEIISSDKKNTKVKLVSKIENINKPGNISLIFSLIKSSKLDYLIQKCTEVGVKSFSPVISLKVRIYLDKKLNLDLDLILEKEDAHYLTHVMRLREGDNVFLFNSKDGEFKGEIISSDKKKTKVKLISKIENLNKLGNISLIFSLIKSSKLDYLIQKCTEVGVKSFSPVISEKSVSKNLNVQRTERIIKESCEQSNQLYLPAIHAVEKLEKKLKSLDKNSIVFFADINSSNKKIEEVLKNNKNCEFYLLVGPEGDFSLKERDLLNSMSNCIPISLGQNILRSETAAVVGLTILNYQIN